MEGAHVIEVNDLVVSMTSKLKLGRVGVNETKTDYALFNKIKRIPCDADREVYEPSVVSIGPYHHGTQATLEMERRKWESFRYILQLNPEKKLRDYLDAIAGLEQQIRSCYANKVKTGTDKLLTMMLLDGCFLLYILNGIEGALESGPNFNMPNTDERKLILEQSVNETVMSIRVDAREAEHITSSNMEHDDSLDNTYYSEQWYNSFLTHDLVLLENQIPFFVVVKIFELVTDGKSPVTVLLQNVSRFMEDLLHSYPKVLKFNQPEELHHLLHLCHLYFKPNQQHVKNNPDFGTSDDEVRSITAGQQLLGWHQATEYQKAGIEFKKRESCIENPHSLLDIRFCGGVLEMPCLTIDTNTYSLFRNLIAFEEICPRFGNYITAYVVFLSQFIRMPDDVSLLIKSGIVVHQLDSDAELSELFRMLAEGVTFDFNGDYCLKNLFHVMEVHYQV